MLQLQKITLTITNTKAILLKVLCRLSSEKYFWWKSGFEMPTLLEFSRELDYSIVEGFETTQALKVTECHRSLQKNKYPAKLSSNAVPQSEKETSTPQFWV